jgi:tetratricopeptide (TPR) repeat protein
MKRAILGGLGLFLVILFPFNLMAAEYIAEADKLFELGGLENYKQAIDLYQKAIAHNPGSYEANWKCARAHREYGNAAKTEKVDGWKDICARYGKEGMNYARKATELEPEKPDGYYYFGLNVGIYSDGVSIFTALSEGLKDKTQSSFEKTYELEKMYKEGGSILALGRFWAMLPWPMRDRDKSLKYYREYQATEFFADNLEAHVYLGELLIQIGGDKNKTEAKGYLKRATQSNDPYFRDKAMELLAKLNIN